MKKIVLIFTLLAGAQYVFAQTSETVTTDNGTYAIYQVPDGQTPATVTRLGAAPQFTSLRHVETADDMYARLKTLGNEQGNGEINTLFMGMGYAGGVNDPAFGPDDLQQAKIPYGAMGMMGGRGNKYKYTILVPANQPTTDAWQVKAANTGKDVYFFAACGNAFYYTNPPATAQVIVKEKYVKDYSGYANVRVKVYARNKNTKPCAWCGNCTEMNTADDETVLLSEDDIAQIPVTKDGSDYPVKNLYIDVDKHTFKKIKAKEEDGEYKMKEKSADVSMN